MERRRDTKAADGTGRRASTSGGAPRLFASGDDWRLDEATRARGLAGVARARQALADIAARAAEHERRHEDAA